MSAALLQTSHAAPGVDVGPEVLRQQQIHLVQRLPLMAQVNAFNALLVVAMMWTEVSRASIVIWYALMLAICAAQFLSWRRLASRPTPSVVSGGMLKKAKFWSAGAGLLWGSTLIVFHTPDSVPLEMFLSVVVAGMAAGTVSLLGPIPSINSYFLVSILTPLTIQFGLVGDKLHLVVAILGAMFGVTLQIGSRKSFRGLQELVRSSLERERAQSDLVDALESTNDGFAMFDKDKQLVTSNRRFRTWFSDETEVLEDEANGRLRRVADGSWVYSSLKPTSHGGYVSVHFDYTKLRQREEELIAAKQRAEQADRAKSQFLANMSHELRTPLNAVIGFSQMMKDQSFGPMDDRYQSFSQDIHDAGRHLLSIISDILDISKIESSTYDLNLDEVEVDETIAWAVSMCRGRADASGQRRIDAECDADLPAINADPRAMKQILLNLIGNALKFTPPDKSVGVRAGLNEDGGLTITVWDEGIGIPAEKIQDVCKPFVQVEDALRKQYEGAGLGLAICESLTRLHDGELRIESTEGVGTTVSVVFPPSFFIEEEAPRLAANG